MRISFLIAMLVLTGLLPAMAQQKPDRTPMTIGIVRSAQTDCEPQCQEWIAAQGAIRPESAEDFRKVLNALNGRKLPLVISSPGGNVDAAIEIGRLIREKGMDVAVAQSLRPAPCTRNDELCRRERLTGAARRGIDFGKGVCSSACTFILAGGVNRIAAPTARIGVHQMSASQTERVIERTYKVEKERVGDKLVEVGRTLVSEKVISQKTEKVQASPEDINRDIAEHLGKMGISKGFLELTLATPASTIRVLTPREMTELGIITDTGARLPVLASVAASAAGGSFRGYAQIGPYEGRTLAAEITLDRAGDPEALEMKLLLSHAGKPVPSGQLLLSIILPDGLPLSAVNGNDRQDTGPLLGMFRRKHLCDLQGSSQIKIGLGERGKAFGLDGWFREGQAQSLLPIAGMQAAVCRS